MKVLVTGGAGFIGSHIVDLLIEEGHKVAIIDDLLNNDDLNINIKAKFYKMNILNDGINEIIEKESPEVIIHLAALVSVQESMKNPIADGMNNAIGTLNILKAATVHHVRKFIFSSTCAVYGNPKFNIATNESSNCSPVSFYGASKCMAEHYIQLFYELYQLNYTILRYSNVYGPRQKSWGEAGVVPIFIESLMKGTTPIIYGDGEQIRDFIYVSDVAYANICALNHGDQQTINISSGEGTTINALYHKIDCGMKHKIIPQYAPERTGDARYIILDNNKAKNELIWQPKYSLDEGLLETIGYYTDKKFRV